MSSRFGGMKLPELKEELKKEIQMRWEKERFDRQVSILSDLTDFFKRH